MYDGAFNNYQNFNAPQGDSVDADGNKMTRNQLFDKLGSHYLITVPIAGSASQEPYNASIGTPLVAGNPLPPGKKTMQAPAAFTDSSVSNSDLGKAPTTSYLTQLFGTTPQTKAGKAGPGDASFSGNIFQDFHDCPGSATNSGDYKRCIVTSAPTIPMHAAGTGIYDRLSFTQPRRLPQPRL